MSDFISFTCYHTIGQIIFLFGESYYLHLLWLLIHLDLFTAFRVISTNMFFHFFFLSSWTTFIFITFSHMVWYTLIILHLPRWRMGQLSFVTLDAHHSPCFWCMLLFWHTSFNHYFSKILFLIDFHCLKLFWIPRFLPKIWNKREAEMSVCLSDSIHVLPSLCETHGQRLVHKAVFIALWCF